MILMTLVYLIIFWLWIYLSVLDYNRDIINAKNIKAIAEQLQIDIIELN